MADAHLTGPRCPALDVDFEDDPVAREIANAGPIDCAQIARLYGVSSQAVNQTLHRAIRKLRESQLARTLHEEMEPRRVTTWDQIDSMETAAGLSEVSRPGSHTRAARRKRSA